MGSIPGQGTKILHTGMVRTKKKIGKKKIFKTVVSQVVLVKKNLPANAGDARDSGLIPGLGRSPGRGK